MSKSDIPKRIWRYVEYYKGIVHYFLSEQKKTDEYKEVAEYILKPEADKHRETLLLKAYIQGYETGHNDTVESCYTDAEQSGIDWIEQAKLEGEI